VGCVAPDFKATELYVGHVIRVIRSNAKIAVPYILNVGGIVPAEFRPAVKVKATHGDRPSLPVIVEKNNVQRMREVHPVYVDCYGPEDTNVLYDTKAVFKTGTTITVAVVAIAVSIPVAVFVVLKLFERGDFERRPDMGPRMKRFQGKVNPDTHDRTETPGIGFSGKATGLIEDRPGGRREIHFPVFDGK